MIRVLFVCLGNICRSPMAEAVFRDLVKKEGLDNQFDVDSAGLGSWHIGQAPHRGTKEILKKNNISIEGLIARKFRSEDFNEFDYIIVMDFENMAQIKRLKKDNPRAFVAKLMDFVKGSKETEVPDPYYTGNFEYVYSLITEGCQALLDYIKHENQMVSGKG